jgi:hypothetical protein
MTKEEIKKRTKKFALMIIRLVDLLPNTKAGNTIGNQLMRAGTSVILESGLLPIESLTDILKEANELTAIFTASGKTAKQNKQR